MLALLSTELFVPVNVNDPFIHLAGRFTEVVIRVEPVAMAVVPPRGLERARAGFGHNANHAAVVPPVFRGIAVGDDLDLADGIHVQIDEGGAAAPLRRRC